MSDLKNLPTRANSAGFWLRSHGLMLLRGWRNRIDAKARRWTSGNTLSDAPIRAQVRTLLWTNEREDEFLLTAGKVHNLRLAARRFHAIEIPAGECLSFWQQLGRPSARRGFVVGRELREGCVIPALAGGVCQISNALATAAQRAGFELVEHHAHSARLAPASDHAADDHIDATVFWNYVDLKICAPVAWRLELTLSATDLVLTIRSASAVPHTSNRNTPNVMLPNTGKVSGAEVRNCLNCDQVSCFRHQPQTTLLCGRTAWLLDAWIPEFARYLLAQSNDVDGFLPTKARQWLPSFSWLLYSAEANEESPAHLRRKKIHCAHWASLRRRLWQRRWARYAGRRQASVIDGQRWLAQAYARKLRPEHTHLLIDQGLLSHLQQMGALGGRTYDVLATSLPMDEIQRRLDHAHRHSDNSARAAATLNDFRVDPVIAASETDAMLAARRVITAHAEVAAYWRAAAARDVLQIPWVLPVAFARAATAVGGDVSRFPLVVFPASALARKGACELAQAMRGLEARVRVLGSPSSDVSLWQGVQVEYSGYASDWIADADVVVLPAYIEHAPRAALRAVAAGIPVIATPACGLQGLPGVTLVPAGDVAALRAALRQALSMLAGRRNQYDNAATMHASCPVSVLP